MTRRNYGNSSRSGCSRRATGNFGSAISAQIFVVPGVPYVQALNLGKDELVQALAISAFVSTLALALGLGLNNGLSGAMAAPAMIALVAAFVGMAIGKALRSRLSVARCPSASLEANDPEYAMTPRAPYGFRNNCHVRYSAGCRGAQRRARELAHPILEPDSCAETNSFVRKSR